ncbi:FCD domain-containing protein [Ancylobacter polymorphus]|uniref:FCD domain-containing protein n=1 Tax=Ancylobacter polymorphus TaxID=223390 RepID=A0A9E7CXJ1_9HYPH|nr:FCD domain-containing protein [Ancylobacter polymorphus]UOK72399.1 FCD domain-containing protein [Ancylobacter polymorphus]
MTSSAAHDVSFLRLTSLPMLLEREIESMILDGRLTEGGRINENQLAATFGVSRGPVREALRSLEALGLVELLPNRGVFIRSLDITQVVEMYGVRAALFGYAAQLLAARAEPEVIARLRALLDEMADAAQAHDFDRYYPLNFAFHDFIVERTGNGVLTTQYRGLVKQLRLYRAGNLMTGNTLELSNEEHARIVAAIEGRDAARAYQTSFDHVERGKERLLARSASAGRAEEQSA